MPLTTQYLTDLITQLDILLDHQNEQIERLHLTLSASQQPTTVEFYRHQEQTSLILKSVREDHAVVHDLRRRLIAGLNWASLLDDESYDTDSKHAASTPSAEDTTLF